MVLGDYAFYTVPQGLSADLWDASADEGGNVYVAGGDAIYAKGPGVRDFLRFTPEAAGLTANCHDPSQIANPSPPDPLVTCPVISVGGAAAGRAVIGFKGVGVDYDYDAPWALDSGGIDLVTFDGQALQRDRHVRIASPPGVVCEHWRPDTNNTICDEWWIDSPWKGGRKKMRQVKHIVVNHDQRRALSYGDVYLGATHGTIAVLVAHPAQRGWIDYTRGDPAWADTKGIWEHEHPAIVGPDGRFLSGESTALALDPLQNVPWFANEIRTASLPDYATTRHPSWNGWWGEMSPLRPFLAFFGDAADNTYWDRVSGLSFCDDGTLWVASAGGGIGQYRRDGSWSRVAMPPLAGNVASAIACDPSDGSIWVGFGWGGFARWRNGAWEFPPRDAPTFTSNPVRNIQIDRWSSPRGVYVVHTATEKFGAGGLTVYSGP